MALPKYPRVYLPQSLSLVQLSQQWVKSLSQELGNTQFVPKGSRLSPITSYWYHCVPDMTPQKYLIVN